VITHGGHHDQWEDFIGCAIYLLVVSEPRIIFFWKNNGSFLGDATWWPGWLSDVNNQHLSNFSLHYSFGRVPRCRESFHDGVKENTFAFLLTFVVTLISCSFSRQPMTLITFLGSVSSQVGDQFLFGNLMRCDGFHGESL